MFLSHVTRLFIIFPNLICVKNALFFDQNHITVREAFTKENRCIHFQYTTVFSCIVVVSAVTQLSSLYKPLSETDKGFRLGNRYLKLFSTICFPDKPLQDG